MNVTEVEPTEGNLFPNGNETLIGFGFLYILSGRAMDLVADYIPRVVENPAEVLGQVYEYGGWGAVAVGTCLEVKNTISRLRHNKT